MKSMPSRAHSARPRVMFKLALLATIASIACSRGERGEEGRWTEAPTEPVTGAMQLTAAGLPEPLVTTKPTNGAEDRAIQQAISEFRALSAAPRDDDSESFAPFERFVAAHPHSGWSAAALTNLGLGYYHAGRFSKAFDAYAKAWTEGRHAADWKAKAIVDRAVGELAKMHARIGHSDALEAIFADLGDRPLSGSATELLVGAREGLWIMRNEPGFGFLCGPKALKNVLLALGNTPEAAAFLDEERSGPHGYALGQIGALADRGKLPHRLIVRQQGQAVPVPSVVHWKVHHYAALTAQEGGRFHVQDPTFGGDLSVSRAAIDDEASGFFLVPSSAPQDPSWRDATPEEASTVYGMGFTGSSPPGASHEGTPSVHPDCRGGSCPAQLSIGSLSSPAPTSGAQCAGHGSASGGGLQVCTPDAYASTVSLTLRHTPVGYGPQKGPPVFIRLTYNQREDTQPANFGFFNVGPKWTINVLSYVEDDPNSAGTSVTRYLPGGGQFGYAGYSGASGSFSPEMDTGAVLSRSPATGIATSYTVANNDGSTLVYATPDGATSYPRRMFLTKIIDPQRNQLRFAYDSLLRLTGITDAAGRVTTFGYAFTGPSTQLLVTSIRDPFGRSARLAYDANGRLASITDVSGIVSSFGYDASSLVNSQSTPYGTSTFTYGTGASNQRFITMTDPLGATEGIEFVHLAPGIAGSEPANTLPAGMTTLNQYLYYRNTFYWDKNVYPTYGTGSGKDYTKARRWHFLHTIASQTSTILESVKEPLENRVWFNTVGQTSSIFDGTSRAMTAMGRVLDDGTTQLTKATYNAIGRLTSLTDPAGRITEYVYAANGIDLLTVRQKTATGFSVLASYTYNDQHEPLTYADAAGQVWTYTYNEAGQLTTSTDPLHKVTTYEYDGYGRLTTVIDANGAISLTFSYPLDCDCDSSNPSHVNCDLPESVTDSEGRTVCYQYDAHDCVTVATYPDGTTDRNVYTNLDLTSHTDRLSRTTSYVYDAVRRLIKTTDPLGHSIQRGYFPNGALKTLTDPNGNATTWAVDLQSRPTSKTYADGTATNYGYETTTSHLETETDALNQVKTFGYNLDDTLASITYAGALNPTPNVSFTYDPYFRRRVGMTDGNGTTAWTYIPLGSPGALQVQTEAGPFTNDTKTYGYDALGRTNRLTVGNTAAETWSFDAIGRPTKHVTGLGTFRYDYLGETSQPVSRDLAGTLISTTWYYDTNENDRRLIDMTNTSGARSFTFSYAMGDDPWGAQNPYDVMSVSQTDGNGIPEQTLNYAYDRDDRLLTVTEQPCALLSGYGDGFCRPRVLYTFAYDGSGNFTTFTGSSGTTHPTNNNLNQELTNGSQTFSYDSAGNTTSDGTRTFQWDAEHRVVGITDSDGNVTTFIYDGLGRRIQVAYTPRGGTTSVKRFAWCNTSLCAQRDGADTITRRYYLEGQHDPARHTAWVTTTDHVGSVRDVIAVASEDVVYSADYSPYGEVLHGTGSVPPDFGYAGLISDPKTNILYSATRFYAPGSGRWTARAPIGEQGGVNLYAYVRGNPANYTDPLGIQEIVLGGNGLEWMIHRFRPVGGDPAMPAEQPKPPGWTASDCCSRYAEREGQRVVDPRREDPEAGEWPYAPTDKWHHPHWNYDSWDAWNSKWQIEINRYQCLR